MVIYKVLYYPHFLLKKKSTPVTNFSLELQQFVKDLATTSSNFDGGGLAAPQVGVNKRIFIVDYTQVFSEESGLERRPNDFLVFDDQNQPIEPVFPMAFINPVIVSTSQPINTNWEGCLSFPGADAYDIQRFQEVEIRAQNEYGKFFTVKTNHLYAAVNFLHETDHLDGIMMINRWDKNKYNEKDVVCAIEEYINSSEERRRLKKLKLVEASKIKFDFL